LKEKKKIEKKIKCTSEVELNTEIS